MTQSATTKFTFVTFHGVSHINHFDAVQVLTNDIIA